MKQFLLLCALMFTTPLFASGIDAGETSAPCDNTTLETYGGTANVEINWEPNTIQTRWYNGNTLIDTTNTNATSCEYGDVLNRPTNPTRTGYTFVGWTLRPEMDFGTIPTNEHQISRWGIGVTYDGIDYYWEPGGSGTSTNDSNFNEIQRNEWKVRYTHGALYGMSICSAVSGTIGEPGMPTGERGWHCWCKATGYRAVNSDEISKSIYNLSWVFHRNYQDLSVCAKYCSADCANNAGGSQGFRAALFTPASNN